MAPPQQRPGRRGTRRLVRRVVVLVVGVALLLAGVAMLALPGPGLVTIVAGVAVLSTEFAVARRAQRWMKVKLRQTRTRLRAGDLKVRPPSESARGSSGMEPPA